MTLSLRSFNQYVLYIIYIYIWLCMFFISKLFILESYEFTKIKSNSLLKVTSATKLFLP